MQAAIAAAGGQDCFIMRAPLDLEDLVAVTVKRVQLQFQVAQVPQTDRLQRGRHNSTGLLQQQSSGHLTIVNIQSTDTT